MTRLLGFFCLLLIGSWSIAFAYALHGAMPFNPIKLPLESRVNMKVLLPEGFGFFTRDPRESRLLFYRRSDGGWQSASVGPAQKAAHAFGIERAVRAHGIEAGLLMEQLPDPSHWKSCADDAVSCLGSTGRAATVSNRSPLPTLCGDIAFVEQETMPWAWSARGAKVTMPSKVIRIIARCGARS